MKLSFTISHIYRFYYYTFWVPFVVILNIPTKDIRIFRANTLLIIISRIVG